eukprot:g3035.t1
MSTVRVARSNHPTLNFRNRRAPHILSIRATPASLSVFSPSKINLFLRIIRRRPDGYHDLASLFHVIDLGDSMSLTPIDGDQDTLICNIPDIPTDDSNLVIRALKLYRSKTGVQQCFEIVLKKIVPHGAGLGGGSANAATTLWAANEMCGNVASNDDLLTWSGEIGSDISVFFSKGAAYCTGRGEIVEDVEPPISLATPMLLVKPPVGLSTPAIFKALDLDGLSPRDPLDLLDEMRVNGTVTPDLCVNDLEPPAFSILPELDELKTKLILDGDFESVFMTGSGSTIVCFGSDKIPEFLADDKYKDLFVSPARLISRNDGEWYTPSQSYTNSASKLQTFVNTNFCVEFQSSLLFWTNCDDMEDPWKNVKDIDGRQHYRTLGLTFGATDAQIRRSYKHLARKLHPDKGGDSASFAQLREAFEVLTDPQRRKVYDRWAGEVNFRYIHGVAPRSDGGEEILLRTYEDRGFKCDPLTQLVVTCEVCRRPATKQCWTCKMHICDFCTLKQHWKDEHPLHWPLINSQELRVRLAKSEMQRKIKEDAKNYFMQDPNYRSQQELETIRSFKIVAEHYYECPHYQTVYNYQLAKYYMWAETEHAIYLAVHTPTGYKDRPVFFECDGRKLLLQPKMSRPIIDRRLAISLASSSIEMTSSTDNRFHIIVLPKASPEESFNSLFIGDSSGCRSVQQPYEIYDVDDEVLLELRVPFWIDSEDVRVTFSETEVEISVRNQFHIRRSFWTELDAIRDAKKDHSKAINVDLCSWSLEDEEEIFNGERCRLLSVSFIRPSPTPSEIEWKKGVRQDNKIQQLPGRNLPGTRFFRDDEDEFGLESLLEAIVFKRHGRCFVSSKPWLKNSTSFWATSKHELPEETQKKLDVLLQ